MTRVALPISSGLAGSERRDVAIERLGGRLGEESLDLGAQDRLVGLDGKQVVRASLPDRGGDRRIGGDGVDRDDRVFQSAVFSQALDQNRNGANFIGLVGDRLLSEHQSAGRGEGGNQMQRRGAGAAIVTAARTLAVDGDEIGTVGPTLAK